VKLRVNGSLIEDSELVLSVALLMLSLLQEINKAIVQKVVAIKVLKKINFMTVDEVFCGSS
jgi:hypothetical protein